MSSIFVLLLLVTLGVFIWSLIKPFRFFSKEKLTRKRSAAIFGGIIVLLLILIGNTAPTPPSNASKTETQATNATSPTSPAVAEVKSKEGNIEVTKSPKQVLEAICEKYKAADNCIVTEENGKLSVGTILETQADFMLFDVSKQIARDFIFDIYATKLPIAHAAISINNYQAKKYYRAGLGEDVAKQEPQTTWTDKNVGPSIFYDFLKSNSNGAAGDYKNSTYVETNLK